MHRLVEFGDKGVEHWSGQGDDGIAVDEGSADAHRTHADGQATGVVALHPAPSDQRLHDDVDAALRCLEIASELGQRRCVALGQTFENLHRTHRRFGISLARLGHQLSPS